MTTGHWTILVHLLTSQDDLVWPLGLPVESDLNGKLVLTGWDADLRAVIPQAAFGDFDFLDDIANMDRTRSRWWLFREDQFHVVALLLFGFHKPNAV